MIERLKCFTAALSLLIVPLLTQSEAGAGGAYFFKAPSGKHDYDRDACTVVGRFQNHTVKSGETFLDIARLYDLGIHELTDLYPDQDPWIPPTGMEMAIPTRWILPRIPEKGIVINIPELRLYYFMNDISMVKTCPVGIGGTDWQTPLGTFRISEKEVDPTWSIPPSLKHKYRVKSIPPGPRNPLGEYWLGLAGTRYGIHGTNIPWSVGRLATHGCIRLYPEDIKQLFELVSPRIPVRIIYEPVKLGLHAGKVFTEIHRDIYGRTQALDEYAYQFLEASGLKERIDMAAFQEALERQSGVPVNITRVQRPRRTAGRSTDTGH